MSKGLLSLGHRFESYKMYTYTFMNALIKKKLKLKKDISLPKKPSFFKKDKIGFQEKKSKKIDSAFQKEKSKKIHFVFLKKKKIKPKLKFFLKRYNPFLEIKKTQKRKLKISKAKYGILRISAEKRNIFCTLSDLRGRTRASLSSGLLKVKGRKRQALHIVRATGQIIIKKILESKLTNLILIHKGRAYKKKKKTLLKTFSRVKKLKFLKINRPAPRSHNGCRPRKIRRK
jgi:ribosomal protein S11